MLISNIQSGDLVTLGPDSFGLPRFLRVDYVYVYEDKNNALAGVEFRLDLNQQVASYGSTRIQGVKNPITGRIEKDEMHLPGQVIPTYRAMSQSSDGYRAIVKFACENWYRGIDFVDDGIAELGWRRIDTDPDVSVQEDGQAHIAVTYADMRMPSIAYLSKYAHPGSLTAIEGDAYKVLSCDPVKREWELVISGVFVRGYSALVLRYEDPATVIRSEKEKRKNGKKGWFGR